MMEHFISSDRHFQLFDKDRPPVLTVEAGDTVVFETLDACYGLVHSTEDFRHYRQQPGRGGDPITGPVYVKDAMPGQTLVVHIESIELGQSGFQLIGPDRAMVANEVPDWTCCTVKPDGEYVLFSNGLRLKADPVIGTFGTAPAHESTNAPNRLGGNCDSPVVKIGKTLYIPVEVPGALFGLGDVHAMQGDGEVVGAPEISAKVKVQMDIRPGKHSEWVMVEDAQNWHSLATGPDEYAAAKTAVFQNARFISSRFDIEFKDALILLTAVGKISLSRAGKWGKLTPVVCASFNKLEISHALK
jgi:amidase